MMQTHNPGFDLKANSTGSKQADPALGMDYSLWVGALAMLLNHEDSGCMHSARRAAKLLDRLAETRGIDVETRILCERASLRLCAATREQVHARKS